MRVAAVLNREGGTIRTADVERLCAILVLVNLPVCALRLARTCVHLFA